MPISFDTSSYVRLSESSWQHSESGDRVVLEYLDLMPDLPAGLDDVATLRERLAVKASEVGCLIEADVVALDGEPAVMQLVKLPLPDRPAGQFFLCSFIMPRATCSVVLKMMALEPSITGMREAQLIAQLGFRDWVLPHPYAPDLDGRLPFHRGDDANFDSRFPDHPLTRCREWVRHVVHTARVDSRFAALPAFTLQPFLRDLGTTIDPGGALRGLDWEKPQ